MKTRNICAETWLIYAPIQVIQWSAFIVKFEHKLVDEMHHE